MTDTDRPPTAPTGPEDPAGQTQPVTPPEVYEAYLHNAPRPRRLPQGHQHPIISRLNLNDCKQAAVKIMRTDTELFIARRSDGAIVWDQGHDVAPNKKLDTRDDTVDDASL
jgi:hypothetical protein